jgi:hypothetical protein
MTPIHQGYSMICHQLNALSNYYYLSITYGYYGTNGTILPSKILKLLYYLYIQKL